MDPLTLHPMKLVTIVCEAYALEPIKTLLRDAGATGWTHSTVEGEGEGGERGAEMPEFANVRIEVVIKASRSENLLRRLQQEYFPRYGMIAFESDVRVMRSGHF
jgi:nitrogen regulatory protein PII